MGRVLLIFGFMVAFQFIWPRVARALQYLREVDRDALWKDQP
jgi:hypothetical protein